MPKMSPFALPPLDQLPHPIIVVVMRVARNEFMVVDTGAQFDGIAWAIPPVGTVLMELQSMVPPGTRINTEGVVTSWGTEAPPPEPQSNRRRRSASVRVHPR